MWWLKFRWITVRDILQIFVCCCDREINRFEQIPCVAPITAVIFKLLQSMLSQVSIHLFVDYSTTGNALKLDFTIY